MALVAIRCHECRQVFQSPDVNKIDFTMVYISGRPRPICGPCYEDRRTK